MANKNSGLACGNRRSLIIHAIGAGIGLVMAVAGFIDLKGKSELPDGVIAQVNDVNIDIKKCETLIKYLSNSKRRELTDKDHAYVLERLIEEELLVQRGIELGMIESDSVIRSTIVQAMIKTINIDAAAEEISTEKLKSFYEEHRGFFKAPKRFHVGQISFQAGSGPQEKAFEPAFNKARQAYKALIEGQPFQRVKNRYHDPSILDLPDRFLPAGKVREYLGPSLLEEVKKLKPGEFTGPLKTSAGYTILILIRYQNQDENNFEILRDQVEAEYRKRKDDEGLRNYLDHLKDWADIKRSPISL